MAFSAIYKGCGNERMEICYEINMIYVGLLFAASVYNEGRRNAMKWIEFIRVRSSAATIEEAIPSLRKEINEINASTNAAETFMAQHAIYNGDLSVVLMWKNEIEPMKTREGLLLAEKLQHLGSVDHAVWIPVRESDQ